MIVSGYAWAGQSTVGHAIVVGGSDIGRELAKRLLDDSWEVTRCKRGDYPLEKWDLLIIPQGTLKPFGRFLDCYETEWEQSVVANALEPLRIFRRFYPTRMEGSRVVFFGGTNPLKVNINLSAYASAKALLREAVKTIAAEHPEVRVEILDPGIVDTKILNDLPYKVTPNSTFDDVYAKLF